MNPSTKKLECIWIVDSVSSRESEQYLDENSKRCTGMLGNKPAVVDGRPSSQVGETSYKQILESPTISTLRGNGLQ